MKTFASLFSGFGGADLGAMAAGLKPLWGVEYMDDIASVARLNGLHSLTADILECDPKDFERPDILHASPPCPNFSNAKAGAEETPHDIALAQKVADFITELLPDFFTLENVYAYRKSKSWHIIARALLNHGYQFNYWHVSAADYGVPQTRKRMIVIARRDGIKPMLPPASHAKNPEAGLFGTLKRWVGWYEAVEDLMDGLLPWIPTNRVTDTYPDNMPDLALINAKDATFGSSSYVACNEPSFTITSSHGYTRVAIYKDGNHYSVNGPVLARFQSFPDCYELPDSKSLACRGIGNAVPVLFARRLFESLI